MKAFILFFNLIFFTSTVSSDTFYIISGKKVELDVIRIEKGKEVHKEYTLTPSNDKNIEYYKKVCSKSDDMNYKVGIKVGIKEDKSNYFSLKPTSPCYSYFHKGGKKNESKKSGIALLIKWVEGKLQLRSSGGVIEVAEGRSGDAVKISLASYPSISIDLNNNAFSRVELKLIKNKSLIHTKNIKDNFIFINDLAVNNIYLLKIYGEKNTIKMSQRFVITE